MVEKRMLFAGGCRIVCSNNNVGSPRCDVGKCTGLCDPGFADCNSDKQIDGCEINTQSNPAHCGGCNQPCQAGQICKNGTCL